MGTPLLDFSLHRTRGGCQPKSQEGRKCSASPFSNPKKNGIMTTEQPREGVFCPAPAARWNFSFLGMRIAAKASTSSTTAILSNLGVLHVPEEFSPYIRLFDVFTSTPKLELCVCSFQDVLTLSFTSCFESSTVQRNFFRMLSGHGIDVEIAAKQDRRK